LIILLNYFFGLDAGNISPKFQVKGLGVTVAIRYKYIETQDIIPYALWFFNGKPLSDSILSRRKKYSIEETGQSTILIIRNINFDDAGIYQCVVKYTTVVEELFYEKLRFETTSHSVLKIDGIHRWCIMYYITVSFLYD